MNVEELLDEAMSHQVADVSLEPGLVRAAVRRRARHRRTGQAAVILTTAVAVAGGTVAIGESQSTGHPSALVPASMPASPPVSPSAADDPFAAELLDNYLPATGPEGTAGNIARATLDIMIDKAVAACREQLGLLSTLAPESVSTLADSLTDPTQFPDRGFFAAHGSFTVDTTTPLSAESPPTQCLSSDASEKTFPSLRSWSEFLDPWMKTVEAAQSSPAVKASLLNFRSCVIAAGAVPRDAGTFTGAGADGGVGASAVAFADFIGFAGGPADGAAAITREKPWVPVFNRCAGPTIDLQEAAQQAARASFEAAHSAEITALMSRTEAELASAEARYGSPTP